MTRPNFRKITADILDENSGSFVSKVVTLVIIFTIVITIVAIILESVPTFGEKYNGIFTTLEFISMIIFTTEYVLRVWSEPERSTNANRSETKIRLNYVITPAAIIDLLAILPFLLSMFSIDLRFLRVIRLLRVFKLTRYSSTMNMLLVVLKKESRSFFAAFFVLFIMLIIASSGIYLIEHNVQPDSFGSIPQSMWWAMVTLTTVGYGDVTPITTLGKVFGGLITLIGIGIVALPAGILASGFSEQLSLNRQDYLSQLKEAIADGIIDEEEYIQLKNLRQNLNISENEAKKMLAEQIAGLQLKGKPCAHCGKIS